MKLHSESPNANDQVDQNADNNTKKSNPAIAKCDFSSYAFSFTGFPAPWTNSINPDSGFDLESTSLTMFG